MNKAVFIGRIVRDIELRVSQNENQTGVAKFCIAVDRKFKRDGEPDADFLNCISFGKQAEIISKYFTKGMKIALVCHVLTGNYTNKDGIKVYTTDFVVDEFEFVESKGNSNSSEKPNNSNAGNDGFMQIADDSPEELPFS